MNNSKLHRRWGVVGLASLLAASTGCTGSSSTTKDRDYFINNVEGTYYADTGWNGTHSGPRNDDVARIDIPRGFRHAWEGTEDNAFIQGQSIGFDESSFIAADGSLSWKTTNQLDVLKAGLPPSDTLGEPIVASSSILLILNDKVLQYVTVGYSMENLFPETPFLAPVRGFLVTRDRTTGELVEGSVLFPGRTSLENLVTPHKSGRVAISYGGLIASALAALEATIDENLPEGVSLLPNDPGMQVVEGIDETTIGELVDGVINSGDFVVALGAANAVTGSAQVGTATVEIDVQRNGSAFEGTVTITDEDGGIEGTLQIADDSLDTGLGPHAAGGTASGTLSTADGETEVEIPWLVKDWS